MDESAKVKINLNLIPEATKIAFMAKFARNYERFWADPNNEAEYEAWKAEQALKGGEICG